jgi:hypothetical protein
MIILTPVVVNNEYDIERIKQIEFARMNWCLADVIAIHGDIGGNAGAVFPGADVIYPDETPTVEIVPVPEPPYGLPPAGSDLPPAGGELPPEGVWPPGAAPPGTIPVPAPPSEVPLIPPGFPPPESSQRDSHRRLDSAYVPPQRYPFAPAVYEGPAHLPPMR